MYAKYFASVLAIAVVLAGVGFAQATTIISDNFNSYSLGDLAGQTGTLGTWQIFSAGWDGSSQVIDDPTSSGRGKVLTTGPLTTSGANDYGTVVYYDSTNQTPMLFSSGDKVELSYSFYFKSRVSGTLTYRNNFKAYVSMVWQGAGNSWPGAVGGPYDSSTSTYATPNTMVGTSPLSYGDDLTSDAWYDVKAELDFSVTGIGVTYKYRLSGTTDWTTDSHFTTLGRDANVDGKYESYGIMFYTCAVSPSYPQYGYIDDVSIVKVPEPGTLALLGCGLVGLLCYAWRKRR